MTNLGQGNWDIVNTVIKCCFVVALAAWLGACTAKPVRDVGVKPIPQPAERALTKKRVPVAMPKSTPRVRFLQESLPRDRMEELGFEYFGIGC